MNRHLKVLFVERHSHLTYSIEELEMSAVISTGIKGDVYVILSIAVIIML